MNPVFLSGYLPVPLGTRNDQELQLAVSTRFS